MATRNIVPRATGEGSLGTETKKWGNIYADNLHSSNPLPIANGGTGASTVAGARNALGLGNTTGALPIANGGTGASTAEQARTNLGIKDIATYDVLPIANGGTGASSASQACANLGALPTSGGVMIGQTAMVRNVANSSLRIGGGLSYEAGASLSLCGKSMTDYAGQFLLGAGDETAKKFLNGFPSGELYWDSKRVLTCDTSFNSTSKQSVFKFSDGTMIICGTVTTNTSAYVYITYNVPFTAIPYSFTCAKMAEGELLNHYTGTSEETATGLQVKTNLIGINAVIEFMALGRWY